MDASGFGLSSDGTTIHKTNYKSCHITLPVQDSEGSIVFKTRLLEVKGTEDHTSATQMAGDKEALEIKLGTACQLDF